MGRAACLYRTDAAPKRPQPSACYPSAQHLLLLIKQRGRRSQRKDNNRELGLGEANSWQSFCPWLLFCRLGSPERQQMPLEGAQPLLSVPAGTQRISVCTYIHTHTQIHVNRMYPYSKIKAKPHSLSPFALLQTIPQLARCALSTALPWPLVTRVTITSSWGSLKPHPPLTTTPTSASHINRAMFSFSCW